MRDMLMRGFTTVRDVGGADLGLRAAAEEGHFPTPRLSSRGKASEPDRRPCAISAAASTIRDAVTGHQLGALGRICDGSTRCAAPRARRSRPAPTSSRSWPMAAAPRRPTRSISSAFRASELHAIVEEAADGAAPMSSAHVYTDEAIRRAVECGVHSLEHCNLIQAETAKLAAENGAVAVPTLVTYDKLAGRGRQPRLPARIRSPRSTRARSPAWNRSRSCGGRARRWPMAPTCSARCTATSPRNSSSAAASCRRMR